MIGYFNKLNHMGMVSFKEEAILLNLKKDCYYIFDRSQSTKLDFIFKNKWEKKNSLFYLFENSTQKNISIQELNDFILMLINKEIISPRLYDAPCHDLLNGRQSTGVENIDWHLPLHNFQKIVDKSTLYCLFNLIKIHFIVQFFGISSLVKMIHKKKSLIDKTISPQDQEINEVCQMLNQACRLFPFRTKCLEWSSVFAVLGLERGWDITLKIGVQNYPFLAHAWTEISGKVIFDDPLLSKSLSTILSAPFSEENK